MTGSNDKMINIWTLCGCLTDLPPSPDFNNGNESDVIPYEYMCPITQDIMRNPVKCSGITGQKFPPSDDAIKAI